MQALLPPEIRARQPRFYGYSPLVGSTVGWLPLAAAATTPGSFIVDTQTDFICTSIAYAAMTDSGALTPAPFLPCLIQIRDTGSSDNWFDNPVHIATVASNVLATAAIPAVGPVMLDVPRTVKAGSTVTVSLQNMDGANDWGVFILFRGARINRN